MSGGGKRGGSLSLSLSLNNAFSPFLQLEVSEVPFQGLLNESQGITNEPPGDVFTITPRYGSLFFNEMNRAEFGGGGSWGEIFLMINRSRQSRA